MWRLWEKLLTFTRRKIFSQNNDWKCYRCLLWASGQKGLSDYPEKKFEFVIIVKLNKDFELEGIYEVTWDKFLELRNGTHE